MVVSEAGTHVASFKHNDTCDTISSSETPQSPTEKENQCGAVSNQKVKFISSLASWARIGRGSVLERLSQPAPGTDGCLSRGRLWFLLMMTSSTIETCSLGFRELACIDMRVSGFPNSPRRTCCCTGLVTGLHAIQVITPHIHNIGFHFNGFPQSTSLPPVVSSWVSTRSSRGLFHLIYSRCLFLKLTHPYPHPHLHVCFPSKCPFSLLGILCVFSLPFSL